MLGALWFLLMFLQSFHLKSLARESQLQDAMALGLYYLCVVVCFVLSTVFHTFSDHSQEMHKFGNELDHLGIVLVMWGTGMSGTHFAFYCHHLLRNTYFAILTGTAFGCAFFTLRPKFRQPAYRTTRFLMYVFLGTSLFAPIAHGWLLYEDRIVEMMGLKSFLGLAAINFSGAALYAVRIPERLFPGKFDLLGQSHNWMHVLVLTGALVRLDGLVEVVRLWQDSAIREEFCTGTG